MQYSSCNSASRWDDWQGLTGKDAQKVAEFNVGRYAVGAIAVLDSNNPRREAPGQRPWEGVVLKVKWTMVWISLGMLLGGQLVIGLVTMVKANTHGKWSSWRIRSDFCHRDCSAGRVSCDDRVVQEHMSHGPASARRATSVAGQATNSGPFAFASSGHRPRAFIRRSPSS
jgi:hypothetical protein